MMHMASKHAQQLFALSPMAGAEAPLPPALSWKGAEARRGGPGGNGGQRGAWGTKDQGVQVSLNVGADGIVPLPKVLWNPKGSHHCISANGHL